MNELLFFAHIVILCLSLLIALRSGASALIGLICVMATLMNIFVPKQISLFHLTVTTADAFAVGITLSLNMLQEFYSRSLAQRAIWISFATSVFVLAMSAFQIFYVPAPVDTMHSHFIAILQFVPRSVIASLISYFIVLSFDTALYAFLKREFGNHYLLIRNYASVGLSQLLDTIIFSFLGLYGIVASVTDIIFFSYAVKMVVILLATPSIMLARKFIHPGDEQ